MDTYSISYTARSGCVNPIANKEEHEWDYDDYEDIVTDVASPAQKILRKIKVDNSDTASQYKMEIEQMCETGTMFNKNKLATIKEKVGGVEDGLINDTLANFIKAEQTKM